MKPRGPAKQYRQLDPQRIAETVKGLSDRIHNRFPLSGLALVADDLVAATEDAAATARRVRQRHLWLRIISILISGLLICLVFYGGIFLRINTDVETTIYDLFQGIESFVNDVIFAAVAIWFLFTLETRRKRHIVLRFISQLRSLAHVIDMHQLAKNPDLAFNVERSEAIAGLPSKLTPSDLTRYLDYCSEMLSILGKLGAIQVQKFEDPVSLEAMTDLENLTNGLSRKIWQKIMIIDRLK